MTRTLLVIDDNKSVRDSLQFLLANRGYMVLTAADGPEAVALATQVPIDGALIDVNMPGMNGHEVCRTLRAQAAAGGREIAVWMMTGARTAEVARLAAEAGALGLFGKPFSFAEVFATFDERLMRPEPSAVVPDAAVPAPLDLHPVTRA